MENKHTPQALNYFWKILDIQRTGYLTIFCTPPAPLPSLSLACFLMLMCMRLFGAALNYFFRV